MQKLETSKGQIKFGYVDQKFSAGKATGFGVKVGAGYTRNKLSAGRDCQCTITFILSIRVSQWSTRCSSDKQSRNKT